MSARLSHHVLRRITHCRVPQSGRRVFTRICIVTLALIGLFATSALAQNIQVSPAALSATVVKGQTTTLTLNLQKTGAAQNFWEPKSSVTWISLSPTYGSSNTITTEVDQVRVTINSATMTIGSNFGLVYITQSGPGISYMASIPVTVTVTQSGTTTPPPPASPPPASPPPASPPPASPPPASPPPASPPPSSLNSTITAWPTSLSATVVKGQTTTLTLNLQKNGTAQHFWEPKASVGWAALSPTYGSSNTITTELDSLRITVNSSSLAIGMNSGLIYVWESGPGISRLIQVPITITVAQTGTTTPPPPASPPPASPPPSSPPPASPPPASPPPASPPPSSLNSTITAWPASFSANVVKGQTTTLTLNLQKSGTTQHFWEPKTSVTWASLSPTYGSSNSITTELDRVQVTINSSAMPLGTNSGLIYITESGPGVSRLIQVPITVNVQQTGTTTPPSPPPPVGGITPPPPPPPPPSPANGTATVTWSPNTEADLAGYKLYVGTSSGIYSRTVDVGKVTSYVISLPKGVTYFFVLTAYDRSGNESGRSAELSRSLF